MLRTGTEAFRLRQRMGAAIGIEGPYRGARSIE